MPATRELMRAFVDEGAARLKGREARAIPAVTKRIMTPALQAQILEAAAAEREAVLARVQVLEHSLASLERRKAEARQAEREAVGYVLVRPAQKRRRWDGTVYETPAQVATVTTPATVEARAVTHAIDRQIKAHRAELGYRRAELNEIRKVQDQVEAGIVTGLLHIVDTWRGRAYMGGLAPAARLGRSLGGASVGIPCDRFGTPLPPEALDAEGKPDLPGRPVVAV